MKINRKLFPYVLTLPALLVCVGILIPFFTAVYYSLQRYNLKMPHMKGFIWFDNYVNIFTDPSFWNTIRVSLTYTFFTIIEFIYHKSKATFKIIDKYLILII